MIRVIIPFSLQDYYFGHQIRVDEMSGTFRTHVGEETWMYSGGSLERRDHCGDLSVDWRIILMLTVKEQ
jgi:hypothetical protein